MMKKLTEQQLVENLTKFYDLIKKYCEKDVNTVIDITLRFVTK